MVGRKCGFPSSPDQIPVFQSQPQKHLGLKNPCAREDLATMIIDVREGGLASFWESASVW